MKPNPNWYEDGEAPPPLDDFTDDEIAAAAHAARQMRAAAPVGFIDLPEGRLARGLCILHRAGLWRLRFIGPYDADRKTIRTHYVKAKRSSFDE